MEYAIIGCGNIGAAHAGALAGDPRVERIYFYDVLPEAAATLAERFDGETVETLSAIPPAVRAVSITSPPAQHHQLARFALEREMAVFCEKPLAMTEREAAGLVRLAEERRVPLSVGFKMRYEPVFRKARDLIGRIGRLYAFSTVKAQQFPRSREKLGWVSGVGAMYELSVHEMDLVGWITGRGPRRIVGASLSFRLGWQREDGFTFIAEYEDGMTGSMTCSYVENMPFQYRDLQMEFVGERGYLRVERPDRITLHTDEVAVIAIDERPNTFVAELGAFLSLVDGDAAASLLSGSGIEGYVTTSMVEAVYRSGTNGAPEQMIPLDALEETIE